VLNVIEGSDMGFVELSRARRERKLNRLAGRSRTGFNPPMRTCPECRLQTVEAYCPRDGCPTVDVARLTTPVVDPNLGTVFEGRYRIEAVVAEGGMGVVYRAVQLAANRQVAIKLLRREDVRADDLVRLHQEARAIAELNHPNTVRFLDFGETHNGRFYLVMELLWGRTLAAAIHTEAPFAPERALAIARAATSALSEAHSLGIVHRDLKPENLFLARIHGQPEFVKVLDFGLSKRFQDPDEGLTPDGRAVGSPRYMSPEQATGMPVTPASDVYAMGTILYEMLTGAHPFRCETPPAYMIAHATLSPIPLSEHIPSLSGALPALVLRCLAKSVGARPKDADELLAQLDALATAPPDGGADPQGVSTREVATVSASSAAADPMASLAAQQRGTVSRTALGELDLTPRGEPDAYDFDPVSSTRTAAIPAMPTLAPPVAPLSTRLQPFKAPPSRRVGAGAVGAGIAVGVLGTAALAWWLLEPPRAPPSEGPMQPEIALVEPPRSEAPPCGKLGVPCPAGFICTEGGTCTKGNLVFVPGGAFERGCPAGARGDGPPCPEDAPHGPVVTGAFAVAVHEVTVEEYQACIATGECSALGELASDDCNHALPNRKDHPVNCVTWSQARRYCERRGERLCTEAEWEKAARGTDARPYPWGTAPVDCDRVVSRLVRLHCGPGTTEPVASRSAGIGPYGAYDLVGNVEEWVADLFRDDAYTLADPAAFLAPAEPGPRVVRGGSYRESIDGLTAYHRRKRGPDTVSPSVGFRCCLSLAVSP
jgi:serine/threonine protein kinase/formylglycine-generating enzyme required for sulfatase activity